MLLDHGDLLVMDGQCQDEFLHSTDPRSEQERIDVTFRWIVPHAISCSFFEDRSGVLFAKVCVRPCYGVSGKRRVLGILGAPSDSVYMGGGREGGREEGGAGFAGLPHMSTGSGLRRCAYRCTRPLGGGRWGHYLRGPMGVHRFLHRCAWKVKGCSSYNVGMMLKMLTLVRLHGLHGHTGKMTGSIYVRFFPSLCFSV